MMFASTSAALSTLAHPLGGAVTARLVTPKAPLASPQAMLVAPFDAMRTHYAAAVGAGIVPRSKLASGQLERYLNALEFMMLGPLARSR